MVKAGKWGGGAECVCVPSNGEGGCGCMCVWPQKLFVKWTLFRIHIIQSQSLKYSLASFEEGRGQSSSWKTEMATATSRVRENGRRNHVSAWTSISHLKRVS